MPDEINYSPKLKEAMEEIKAVLRKHDIAGLAVLHTPGFAEYLIRVDPTYSAATLIEGVGMRVTASEAMYGKEGRNKKISDTENMLSLLAEVSGKCSLQLMDLEDQLKKGLEAKGAKITHDRPVHTPDEKKPSEKKAEDYIFSVTHQYKLYLRRVNLDESKMHPTQRTQLKETFFAAFGQLLLLQRDEVSVFDDDEIGVKILQSMLDEIAAYFETLTNRKN